MPDRNEPPNLRYEALQQLKSIQIELQLFKAVPEIQAVSEAFKRNLGRVISLGLLPARLFDWGYRYHELRRTIAETVKPIDVDNAVEQLLADEYKKQIDTTGLDEQRLGGFIKHIEQLTMLQSSFYMTAPNRQSGLPHAEVEMVTNFHHPAEMVALMSSIIVGAWTAHEVLTEDLWVKFLDLRPRLAFLALNAELDPNSDSPREDKRKKKVTYEVPIHWLREFNYDLNNNMGKLLRDKWNFTRRTDANEAYFKTFPKCKEDLKAILDDRSLQWLAAMRNVIVHASGIADRDFTTLVEDHPVLKLIKKGKTIWIDGELVSSLVEVAMKQSLKLLAFANDWLSKHQE